MPKAATNVARHARNKRTMKAAKGYVGGRGRMYKIAKQSVMRAGVHSYFGRHLKARQFRELWIQRIAAACKMLGTSYCKFIHALKVKKIELDRKSLSAIAMDEPKAFEKLVALAKG